MIERLISNGIEVDLVGMKIKDAGFKVIESSIDVTIFENNIGLTRHIKTSQKPYVAECAFIINAKTMEASKRKMYELKKCLYTCEIYLKQEKNTFYRCVARTFEKRNISGKTVLLKVTFDAEVLSKERKETVNGKATITVEGIRETPINIKVTAAQDISNLKINDITIKSIKKGTELIIDSLNCRIMIDGEDIKEDVVDLVEFPVAQGAYDITVNQDVPIEISYCGRW